MSTTYTAWDGNDYEWPPPKDWYQAVDNRWWAPDTGPAAMGADARLTDATTQMSQDAEILNPAAARQHNIAQSDLPAWAKPSDIPTNRTTYIPELIDDDKNGNGSASILLGIGAVVMTLIIVGLVYFLFLNGDGDQSAQDATVTPVPNSTAAVTVPETSSATSAVETTTTAATPSTVTIEADAYPAFQEAAAAVLSRDDFNQQKILDSANSFCEASLSKDADSYLEYRSTRAVGGEGISVEQAGQILDLYLIHFCPGVATQVGVS